MVGSFLAAAVVAATVNEAKLSNWIAFAVCVWVSVVLIAYAAYQASASQPTLLRYLLSGWF